MRTRTCTASLIGSREENEDRAVVVSERGLTLLAVADGMGGHAAGGEAAEAAVGALQAAFKAFEHGDVAAFFKDAFRAAHHAVNQLGDGMPIEERPRTTAVAALVDHELAWFAHLGDSRAYLLRAGGVVVRTRDHSHVERLVAEGQLAEDRRRGHPLRNLVDRCLGGEPQNPGVEVGGPYALENGDIVLLASDGFWDELDIAAAGAALQEAPDLESALQGLARAACIVGGEMADNATAAVLRVE